MEWVVEVRGVARVGPGAGSGDGGGEDMRNGKGWRQGVGNWVGYY